ncbi:hypothetical protein HBH56_043520 [Parastagonospora nodorum]|uniref:Uncharacterized protein n=2 Tax=Phaeosphaeria nodorum (strain SN15 / ATCC MYA-4574 / FGSC 10173) TaxID=321614 RepID=A0A7U2EXH7_PHANO|nr:hypothetical protein HBH56_043520 [Parastagonospora nodorum]QRC92840.1 hypothetical protein JI435_081070 [Parastagonospora nodorum SN15]KAH3933273.1 hypothetical protein HBH54_071270 [Parastagonospora nodorum]KAH4004001.1 hypothetical protein HBI10_050280 [Parastagonospora nodorum]KAH4018440.1 hypothetical protein HBI13_132830 [Parastagonospora nodorum]
MFFSLLFVTHRLPISPPNQPPEIINMNPRKNQHTNIIDDLDAISLAQQGGKRKTAPKKKKEKTGGAGASGPSISGSSKARSGKKKASPRATGLRFYEKNGVKVPLYEKSGKKRGHARLASSLRNKNTDFLLDLVGEYAGATTRKWFKDADKTKAEMADWIEEQETYALGPNPLSKLDLIVPAEDALWTDSTPALMTYKGKGKGFAPIDAPIDRRPGRTVKSRIHARTPEEQGTKRKRDNTIEPAQTSEQIIKKLKAHQARGRLAKQSAATDIKPTAQSKDERRKSRIEEKMAEFSKTANIPKLSSAAQEQTPEEEVRLKAEDLKAHNTIMESKMAYLGMHPDNAGTSSRVVNLPEEGEDRVLTAVTNPYTKKHVLHDTAIPHDRTQFQAPQALRAEKPFLKNGKHGRGGDFENDPDRRTGRGHEVTPGDLILHDEYIDFRALVYKKYPGYPGVAQGEEMDTSIKEAWDDNERWHTGFNYKYGGNMFNHVWPCGCEKLRGESEDEESEEE